MESFRPTADVLLTAIHPLGKIQTLFLVTFTYINLFLPLHSQSVTFIAATPEHHCAPTPGNGANESIPTLDGGGFASCKEYVDPVNMTNTRRCQNGWEYERNAYGETIISGWNLVCGQNAAAEISQMAFQTGGLTGALLFGMLADRYGRRPSFRCGLVLFNLSSLALCTSVSYIMFVIIRFFNGVFHKAVWVTLSSNLSEYMIPKYRGRAMAVPGVAYTFSLMLLGLLAFLIRDWRFLQLAVIAPMVVGSFAMWFLPESLRWLMSEGKDKKADVLVERLAKINGVEDLYGKDSLTIASPQPPSSVYTISGGERRHDPSRLTSGIPEHRSEEDKLKSSSVIANGSTNEGYFVGNHPVTSNGSLQIDNAALSFDANGVRVSREASSFAVVGLPPSSLDVTEESPEIVAGVPEVDDVNATANDTLAEESSDSVDDTINGRASWSDLFKGPVLHVTLVISLLRFTHVLVYFGFALSTGRVAGNPYLNFFFSALVELPARLLATVVYKRIRRTYLLSSCFFACFAGLILVVVLPDKTQSGFDLSVVRSVLSLCGKFFVTLTQAGQLLLVMELYPTTIRIRRTYLLSSCFFACFAGLILVVVLPDKTQSGFDLSVVRSVLSLCGKFFVTLTQAGQLFLVMELYPTTIRNMGHGWTTCMGRCGAIVAPFILYLDKVIGNFSSILMAFMSFVTAVVMLTLPDTRRTAQPQSVADLSWMMTGARVRRKKGGEKEIQKFKPPENRGFELDR